jgi:hypothetical protein
MQTRQIRLNNLPRIVRCPTRSLGNGYSIMDRSRYVAMHIPGDYDLGNSRA